MKVRLWYISEVDGIPAMRLMILFLVFVGCAGAQTIAPVTVEGKNPLKGQFTATNNQLKEILVTVSPYSVEVQNSKVIYKPLGFGQAGVKLSESSFRLGPKQSRVILYQVTCSRCAIALFTTFYGSKKHTGTNQPGYKCTSA